MRTSWSAWLQDNFNILFLGGLFILTTAFTVHSIHHSADSGAINWLEGIAGQFMAALIGLMTGTRLAKNKDSN